MMIPRPRDWPHAVKLGLWRAGIAALLGAMAALAWDFRWSVVRDSLPFLLRGLGISWLLTIISVLIGLGAGTLLALARTAGPAGIRHLATVYIEVIRAIPQLMVIFWVFFGWPAISGKTLSAWSAALISLTMIAASYLAEVVRAGLGSVPEVQVESAYATGLTKAQTFARVVLPQAFRNMLPALIAHIVMMFKITSLVYVIGLIDFFRAIVLVNNRDFAPYALYTTMAVGYFVCCWALSWLVRRLDPKYTLIS